MLIYYLDCCSTSTGWPRSYRKYILQITQPSQYGYAKLQYRFTVTSGWPMSSEYCPKFCLFLMLLIFIFYATQNFRTLPWLSGNAAYNSFCLNTLYDKLNKIIFKSRLLWAMLMFKTFYCSVLNALVFIVVIFLKRLKNKVFGHWSFSFWYPLYIYIPIRMANWDPGW